MFLFSGLLEVDIDFRSEVIGYSQNGAKNLPRHRHSFIKREETIHKLNIQLKNGKLSNEKFLQKVSDLFIHKNWYQLVKDAVARIEHENSNSNNSQQLDDIADAIFVTSQTSSRIKNISKKYFGDDWVNNC